MDLNDLAIPDRVDAIVTHHGCHDGFTAQWMLHLMWPTAKVWPGVYGADTTDLRAAGMVDPDSVMVMADFTYQRDVMCSLAETWGWIIVLDHHESAQANLTGLPDNIDIVFDMDRSGAGLVADWLNLGRGRRCLVDYVEDRDLWRWALPDSREIAAVIGSTPHTYESWTHLDLQVGGTPSFSGAPNTRYRQVVVQGEAILRRDAVIIDELVTIARPMEIGGYVVPVAPSPYALGSDVAGRLAEGQPFAAYYRDLPGRREFGLRSTGDGVNVRVIAEQYGGGGHPHASGFRVDTSHPLAGW